MMSGTAKSVPNAKNMLLNSAKNLDKSTKLAIIVFTLLQILLTLLDLIGVALLGLVGAISISGVQNGKLSGTVSSALHFFQISNFSFQGQVAILATLATLVLFLRTIFSIYLSRKSLFFFARKSAALSSHLTHLLLSKDLLFLRRRSSQETLFALSTGCNLLYVGILANTINLVSDVILLVFLSGLAVVFQPVVAILLFILLTSSSLLLHFFLNKRARSLGENDAKFSIAANSKILESMSLFREIYVHDKSKNFSSEIEVLRKKSAFTQAEIAFLPNISRYIVEITMLVSVLSVSAAQFILFDVATAVSTLTLFLAAGSRLAPALLRVQQGSLGIRNALGGASATLSFISEMNSGKIVVSESENTPLNFEIEKRPPRVELIGLSFSYPENDQPTLKKINLVIPEGKTIALVGPSAAGKTTLVDTILGVIPPSSGSVKLSSYSPRDFIRIWPNAVSYVPQSVFIANDSLRANIALGFAAEEISDERVMNSLQDAQLLDLLEQLPMGLDSNLEENGVRLSGGQRQRLGIARALYTQPSLIVFDEATSALDAETERLIGESIRKLRSSATVIVIAHRLSTAKNADIVCYMELGELLATGTFEEVRQRVPQFDNQAKLMGL
jgi:ABC-type multidrug transport system fused ATPase/permease subunit